MYRGFNPTSIGDVIVFNEHAISQAKAMIVSPADSHRIFLQSPQPRRGFPRIEDNGFGVSTKFWDLVYQEYGVTDELDILSENVVEYITPMPGIIILITKDFYGQDEK